MAIKYFYIGSAGPFFYDDTDALNDPDGNFPGGTLQDALTGDGSINIGGLITTGTVSVGVLKILDTGADHTLRIKPNEDLTGDKILNLIVGDTDRTITLSGNPTLADWFDQAVKVASSPTFVNQILSGYQTVAGYSSTKNFTDSFHYTGFPNRDDTSIAWDDGTYTLTLTATSDDIWINGVVHSISTLTKQLSVGQEAVSGLYWFWITAPGGTPQLNTSTTTPNIGGAGANAGFDQCLVALVYWNTSTSKGIIFDERHWFGRDCWNHEYLHETIGARYYNGMAGTFDDTTITIESGEFYDEDIEHENTQQTTVKVLYHDGDADWIWDTLTTPFKVVNPGVDNTLQYNNGNVLANAGVSKFVNYWVYITPDVAHPVHIVIGTAQYNTLALVRAGTIPSLEALPSPEYKLIYKITYKNVGGTPDYIEAVDYRASGVLPTGSYVATDHENLSNLLGGITAEHYHLTSAEHVELNAWLDDVVLADGGAITTTQVATFAQLVLTPRAAALSAVQGGIFYDSDDNSVYVCTEGA